ncbi:MAG: hypothetical protein QNL88_17770 [Acidobacteriota bacterium]|nr:hypothetical protein [Acidobacteriota bacterium]
MTWKRLVVFVAAALCTTCGSTSAHAFDIPPDPAAEKSAAPVPDIAATLEALGVCGQIHEAILKLGPRDAVGDLAVAQIKPQRHPSDTWKVVMPSPDIIGQAFAGQNATALELYEFKGTVQALIVFWDIDGENASAVFEASTNALSRAMGPSRLDDDGGPVWSSDSLQASGWKGENGKGVTMLVACLPTVEAYVAAHDSAAAPAEGNAEASRTGDDALPPNPWLNRSIVDILLSFGEPIDQPAVFGTNIVGLHYKDFMGAIEVPTECWWWFVDGKAVYVGADFLPPAGSNTTMSSFQVFKSVLEKNYGAPTQTSPSDPTDEHRVVYSTGPQRLTLELFEPNGDPWFRLEAFDTMHMDALPAELRPNRTLPERYTPPPTDSGTTREDLSLEIGAG